MQVNFFTARWIDRYKLFDTYVYVPCGQESITCKQTPNSGRLFFQLGVCFVRETDLMILFGGKHKFVVIKKIHLVCTLIKLSLDLVNIKVLDKNDIQTVCAAMGIKRRD